MELLQKNASADLLTKPETKTLKKKYVRDLTCLYNFQLNFNSVESNLKKLPCWAILEKLIIKTTKKLNLRRPFLSIRPQLCCMCF